MKIGYKATNNMRCESLTYEVGNTYEISDKKMCSHGFHYCEELEDTLNYYSYEKGKTIFLEIEDLDPHSFTKKDKTISSKIRVLRIVDLDEFKEYKFDDRGNMIKDNLFVYTYNDRNQLLTQSYIDAYDAIPYKENVYDEYGNLIKHIRNGIDMWEKEYNELGLAVSFADKDGNKWTCEYDLENRTLFFEDNLGSWKKIKYNKNWDILKYEDSFHECYECYEYEYNEWGDKIKKTYLRSYEEPTETWEYDQFGNNTSYTYKDGFGYTLSEQKAKFDDRGREISTYHYHLNTTITVETKYDDDQNLTIETTFYKCEIDDEKMEIIKQHDDKGNLIKYKETTQGIIRSNWEITIN